MPSYDFKCNACKKGATLVVSLGGSDPVPPTSPTCDGCSVLMVRTFGIGAVTFKGQGFYVNDKI